MIEMSFDSFDEVVVDGAILEAKNFKASKDVQNSKTNVGLANVVYIGWNFTAAVKEMPSAESAVGRNKKAAWERPTRPDRLSRNLYRDRLRAE